MDWRSGRGWGGRERGRRDKGDVARTLGKITTEEEDSREKVREERIEEPWLIIGEETGASRSITTWHAANYRLLINMLKASSLLFLSILPSSFSPFYTRLSREPQRLRPPSKRGGYHQRGKNSEGSRWFTRTEGDRGSIVKGNDRIPGCSAASWSHYVGKSPVKIHRRPRSPSRGRNETEATRYHA